MESDKNYNGKAAGKSRWDELRSELENLDKELIEADGVKLKPSQCYRITDNSLQVIYNTNCPGALRETIESILSKYAKDNSENYPPAGEFYFP